MATLARPYIPVLQPERRTGALSDRTLQWLCLGLPLAATVYSAFIALMNAHGLGGSYGLVVLCEVALLGLAVLTLLLSGLRRDDWPTVFFLFFLVATALVISMVNDRLMLETLRSTILIGIFALLGQRMEPRTLDRLFLIVALAVLGALLLEIFAQPAYIWLFQPQRFFAATRGMQASEYNSSGLFNNAGSFEGRFSFGVVNVPRTSSIFMEQVSNANFACVLAIYLVARWPALSWLRRGLVAGTIALILVSTNGRFASLLVAVMILGYFVFPLFGRPFVPLVSVAVGALAFAIMHLYPDVIGDSITGRINFVGQQFADVDAAFYLGARAIENLGQRDSGYSYIIGTMSLFGALGLWLYINFYPRADDAPSRRLTFGLVGYMVGQLLVSSTSLFSIKTAAMLWALTGCVRAMPRQKI